MQADDQRQKARGTFIPIVGPSGVGKDSLIAYCRDRIAGDTVAFPRRVITRPAGDDSEDHDTLSEESFAERVALGAFALHWRAHGLRYGIPAAIEDDLGAGRSVIANISRSVIDEARRQFFPALIVAVGASAEILAERIRRRGRETGETLERRLARADDFTIDGPDVVVLDNSGPIALAGDRLVALILSTAR